MKLIALAIAVVVLVLGLSKISSHSAPVQADTAGARVPLENYIEGHATGNGDFMRKAFHPDAKIMAFRDGKMTNLTSEEFASRFNGKPAATKRNASAGLSTSRSPGTPASVRSFSNIRL